MQWTPGGTSSDIEDRRSSSGGGGFGGFGGMHLGIGGTLLLLVLSFLFRQNLFDTSPSAAPRVGSAERTGAPAEQKEVQFVSFVLDDAQKTWEQLLPRYHHAKLVLYRDAIDSACGFAESATGPFYCPGDEKVYLDLGFFDELRQRFAATVPDGFLAMRETIRRLGASRQTVLQRVKRGELVAVHVCRGR